MSGPRIIQDRRVGLAGGAAPRELRFITIVMRQPWTLALPSDSGDGHQDTGHCSTMQHLTLQHSAAVLCSNWTAAAA